MVTTLLFYCLVTMKWCGSNTPKKRGGIFEDIKWIQGNVLSFGRSMELFLHDKITRFKVFKKYFETKSFMANVPTFI